MFMKSKLFELRLKFIVYQNLLTDTLPSAIKRTTMKETVFYEKNVDNSTSGKIYREGRVIILVMS